MRCKQKQSRCYCNAVKLKIGLLRGILISYMVILSKSWCTTVRATFTNVVSLWFNITLHASHGGQYVCCEPADYYILCQCPCAPPEHVCCEFVNHQKVLKLLTLKVGPTCASWWSAQVGGAQCRSMVHKLVLCHWGGAQNSSNKPTQTDRQTHIDRTISIASTTDVGEGKNITTTGVWSCINLIIGWEISKTSVAVIMGSIVVHITYTSSCATQANLIVIVAASTKYIETVLFNKHCIRKVAEDIWWKL